MSAEIVQAADCFAEVFELPESRLEGSWIVVRDEVNLHDLINGKPGRVIRVRNADSLRYIPPSRDDYGRVAGMISDAA